MSISDWDQRLLCPDGGCVGVIGPDGTCKVCGRAAPNWGDERRRGLKTTGELGTSASPAARDDEEDDADEDEDDDDDDDGDGGDEDDDFDDDDDDESGEDSEDGVMRTAPKAGGASPGAWDDRALCSNGACLGVIGADGACKLCGTRP